MAHEDANADTKQAMLTQVNNLQGAVEELQSWADQAATARGSGSVAHESSTAGSSGMSDATGSR